MLMVTVATAVVLSYGPAAALHHVEGVLSVMGAPAADPGAWQTVTAD